MSMTVKTIISVVAYLLLAPFAGALLSGIDRKVTARMQGRQGPPIMQPLYDVAKLLKKETVVVSRVQKVYIVSFFIFAVFTGALFFAGKDMLLVFFALTTANIFLVLAASCCYSPYAHMGAQREILQMLTYEPMVLLTAVGFYFTTGSFKVSEIVKSSSLPSIVYLPGVFVGFIFILSMKLRKHPFDLSTSHHAHQEMVKGITTELSGQLYAVVEIADWYEEIFLLGVVGLFFLNSSWWSVIVAIVCIAITYFIEILVDNTNARLKWQTAFKNTWIVTATVGVINVFILDIITKGV